MPSKTRRSATLASEKELVATPRALNSVGGAMFAGHPETPKYWAPQKINVGAMVSTAVAPRSRHCSCMLQRSWLRTPPLPSVSSPAKTRSDVLANPSAGTSSSR